jgi:two-component system heavy metal sensor histidine kinase CusS
MTFRARITAWYAFALAAGLSLFAATIWLSMQSSLTASLDATLADHSRSLAQFVRMELESPHPHHLTTELREFSQGLPQGIAIELSGGRGEILFSSLKTPYVRQRSYSQHVIIVNQPYDIHVLGSMEPIDETLGRLRTLLLACTPLVILIAASGAYWLSRRALRPVTTIIDAAQTISIDNLSHRLAVPQTGDELQRLSETWNSVLAHLEAAVNRLSQFTADASHELRTPLALIRATAELAARKSRSPETYRAALHEVVAEADRMAQLVEDLLFLARCDAGAGEMPHAPLDLAGIVNEACATISPLAVSKGVHLATNLNPAATTGNEAALRRLTLVLVDNAIKYTRDGGHVEVSLNANRLTVVDTGIGIDPEALPHIFERFYQADPARSQSGYGLGLAQAQSIAARHGAIIQVTSKPGEGSVFEVIFPTALTPAPELHSKAGLTAMHSALATSSRPPRSNT